MKKGFKVACKVSGGKLSLTTKQKKELLKGVSKSYPEDQPVWLCVQDRKTRRSISQNAYYWGVVLKIASSAFTHVGHDEITPEIAHEFFKSKYLQSADILDAETGELIRVAGSSTKLTKTILVNI